MTDILVDSNVLLDVFTEDSRLAILVKRSA